MGSKRKYDYNGFIEIEDNPLTCEGVFDYLGSSISTALDPNRIYKVYRPAEELKKAETQDSFRLKPIIFEHEMLGSQHTPAEEKGVHGVVGEKIRFDESTGMLVGNLQIFSDSLPDKIDKEGIKELSAGYYCEYEPSQGVFNGETYDFIQKNIRVNHIAVVPQGRCGSKVAVLDSVNMEPEKMEEEKKVEEVVTQDEEVMSLAELTKAVKGLLAVKAQDEKEEVMDSKDVFIELAKKTELAEKLSHHIGTFDHISMTMDEIAKYGVSKLNIKCDAGFEKYALDGYLTAAKKEVVVSVAKDSSEVEKESIVEKFIKGVI